MVFYHKGKNLSIAFLSTFFYLYSFAKRTLFRVFHSFFLIKQSVLSEKTLCFIGKNTLFNCKKQPVIKWIKCRVLEEIAKTLSATFQVAQTVVLKLRLNGFGLLRNLNRFHRTKSSQLVKSLPLLSVC